MRICNIVFPLGYTLCACSEDPCNQLCNDISSALDVCLSEWPATWTDLGASSKVDFSKTCSNVWAAERSVLEPRELDDAYEQCDESLNYVSNNQYLCDQLRALYLLPKTY